jgi:hypothetical protein
VRVGSPWQPQWLRTSLSCFPSIGPAQSWGSRRCSVAWCLGTAPFGGSERGRRSWPSLVRGKRNTWTRRWSQAGTGSARCGALPGGVDGHGCCAGRCGPAVGSVAVLGDTLQNVADALTAVPLGVAFLLGRRPATRHFTYGFGRAEDLAGIAIVGVMAASAAAAGYQAIERLLHPAPVHQLWAVAVAAPELGSRKSTDSVPRDLPADVAVGRGSSRTDRIRRAVPGW